MMKNFTENLNSVANFGLSGLQFPIFQPVSFKLRILPTRLPLKNSNEILGSWEIYLSTFNVEFLCLSYFSIAVTKHNDQGNL